MAEIKLTTAQQAVVDDRGGALLVSAAAGSGKTKVLVDRLLSRVCDHNAPCNIDDFLVITYTNAAAAELRLKIAQALSQRLAQQPNDRHLQRQMQRIYMADISTVHSFCSNLLRTYAHLMDIPGDFRMIEDAETQVLQKKVLDTLLEDGYAEDSEEFRLMVETFGYGRDDRHLPEALLMANRAMRCRADMDRWIKETLAVLDMSIYEDVTQTPWGKYIVDEFRVFLARQIKNLKTARTELLSYPDIDKSYGEIFERNIAQMEELLTKETWDEIFYGQIAEFGSLKPVRKTENPEAKERLKNLRNKCWSDLQKWNSCFYAPSCELLDDLASVMPGARALIRFAKRFDDAYSEEKKRRKLLDFSDLEHLAIRLLTDRYTGKPTTVAKEVAKRYVEVMVDEYQDSNQVQEVIFEAVSDGGRNRFMVGDVKQSIYRFRLADPGLFLKKYETYPDYNEAVEGQPRRIVLSENFRSRPEILAACNDVFRLIMRKQVGDLDYGEDEMLRAGREFPQIPQIPVELHCLTNSDPENTPDKRMAEAEFVAKRIRRLLDEETLITSGETVRPVRPGDIVILMRAVSANAAVYLQTLKQYGIPAVCNQGGSLLDTTEVQVLVAMLQIIDDPHQDVPLLTVLASPVFGFTPDELALARAKHRKGDCYETICGAGERFEPFIKLLKKLREEAVWLPLHELVDKVLYETGLIYVFSAMSDGEQRERNLLAFSSFAAGFESNGSRALQQLLWHLSNLQASGGHLPVPQNASDDAVNIMTIHKSKGLEFPVVFLCDLSHSFNTSDMQEAILVDDELAVGCNKIDVERFVRYPTLAKKSIENKKRREGISEELRVLYVAMTRPKDMLIMTYYSKRLKSELKALNSQLTMPLSDELCAGVDCMGKWILIAALCRTEAGELFNLVEPNEVSSVSKYPWQILYHDLFSQADAVQSSDQSVQSAPVMQITHELSERLKYRYAYENIANVPAKLTATQLKGRAQDQEAADRAEELGKKSAYRLRKANFMPKTLTAAEKGTATHLFMQFSSYEACASDAQIKGELDRLYKEGFLSKEQAEAVHLDRILRFFQSELGCWLVKQPTLQREFKFSVLVDAGDFVHEAEGEQMMLQGVVDCFVPENDGITILDFKTDRIDNDLWEKAAYYRPQLEVYGSALSRIYDLPIKKKILYFFNADQAVEL